MGAQSLCVLSEFKKFTLVILVSFFLKDFEGPLQLLLHLIQKEEVDVKKLEIRQLTEQLIEKIESINEIDRLAELMALSAHLLYLKSRCLLPSDAPLFEEEEERVEIIEKLLDYCRVRDAANLLADREAHQKHHFPRQMMVEEKERPSGLDLLSLQELSSALKEVMKNAPQEKSRLIKKETWTVADATKWLKQKMESVKKLPLNQLFTPERTIDTWIVIFLAILELMKLNQLMVREQCLLT